jgi:uncharacterized membrane protein
MKQWMRKGLISASITGTLVLVPAGIVLAHQGSDSGTASARPGLGHRPGGIIDAALRLGSLSPAQRAAVETLLAERASATAPARQAESQLLTALASQVEQAKIDEGVLGPSLNAVENADEAASATIRALVVRLHVELTPAQRSELVDSIEAGHGRGQRHWGHGTDAGGSHEGPGWGGDKLGLTAVQKAQIVANLRATEGDGDTRGIGSAMERHGMRGSPGERARALESFRGDDFDAADLVSPPAHGKFIVKLAEAMLPVLSPAQRSLLAQELRERADHPKPL